MRHNHLIPIGWKKNLVLLSREALDLHRERIGGRELQVGYQRDHVRNSTLFVILMAWSVWNMQSKHLKHALVKSGSKPGFGKLLARRL